MGISDAVLGNAMGQMQQEQCNKVTLRQKPLEYHFRAIGVHPAQLYQGSVLTVIRLPGTSRP